MGLPVWRDIVCTGAAEQNSAATSMVMSAENTEQQNTMNARGAKGRGALVTKLYR